MGKQTSTAKSIRKEVYDRFLAVVIRSIPGSTAEHPNDCIFQGIHEIQSIANDLLMAQFDIKILRRHLEWERPRKYNQDNTRLLLTQSNTQMPGLNAKGTFNNVLPAFFFQQTYHPPEWELFGRPYTPGAQLERKPFESVF